MALSCSEVRDRLAAYAARELESGQRPAIDEHLLNCAECRQELALLTMILSNLEHPVLLEPPPGFQNRVLARLPARQRRFLSPWWLLALTPVLGGIAFLFRTQLSQILTRLLARSGIDLTRIELLNLPAPAAISLQQIAIAVLVVFGFGILAGTFGLALGWKYYFEG